MSPHAYVGRHGCHSVAAILCKGGLDVIRKEAWPFYRTISGVRLCWELEEPKGPKGCYLPLGCLQGGFEDHAPTGSPAFLDEDERKGVSLGYVGLN